jgi:hypothetical protein
MQWHPPETASKDGNPFLADIGLPWAVLCAWDAATDMWATTELAVDLLNGEWDHVYFGCEWYPEKDLKAWMPLAKPQHSEEK